MSDETTQPVISVEPTQTAQQPQSSPVVDPVATQGPTEPVPASTAISETPTMPPVAPEGPTSPVASETNISAPSILEPQNPPSIPVSAPVEPSPSSAPTPTPSAPASAPVPAPADPVPPPQPAPEVQAVAPATAPNPRSFLAKALEKIQFRKRAKLDKIMKFAQGKKEITNDQVEKLLHISDSTAQRYLIQLAKEGKLKRIGKDGSSRYEPLNGSFGGN